MKRLSILAILLLSSVSISNAATYYVERGNSCQRYVVTAYGALPTTGSCIVTGSYDVNSCKEAYDKLKDESSCCGSDPYLGSYNWKCEEVKNEL